jgi:hypothetical protein
VRSRAVLAGGAALVAATAGLLPLVVPAGALAIVRESRPEVDLRTCNGAVALCDRPVDRVAFATAHNAMSSADAGFTNPNQGGSIEEQLDTGIRGLLIDSVEARPTSRKSIALTQFRSQGLEHAQEELGDDGIAAAQSIIARRLAHPTGPPEPYLCHIACELGATTMVDVLHDVRSWLDDHPREVLVIVIQDLVTPARTEQVFRESGMYELVYAVRPGAALPTLRMMIDANRRVLVMAEARGGGRWYPRGYESLLKETPYDNPTVDSLRSDASCRPNRGNEANPLFLVNHWVASYPPQRSKASIVNQRGFLLNRVRRCERNRRAFPNLIAVDFAGIGGVVAVARIVNGIPGSG